MQYEEMDRHVAEDFINGKRISTVWLGIDHNHFSAGEPLLFETMVFNEDDMGNDVYMERYTHWHEAVAGHNKALNWVLDGCNELS
jgi:FKBP-type peptidyl-prolyl cis-trans isomerase 2